MSIKAQNPTKIVDNSGQTQPISAAGFWPSPYDPKQLGASYKSLHSPVTTDKAHYWVVNEPGAGARLYRRLHPSFLQAELDQNDAFAPVDGRLTHGDLLPSDAGAHPLEFFTAPGQTLSIGTRVHEYGGWAWTIVTEDYGPQLGLNIEIVASDAATGLLYHGRAGQIMKPLSTDPLLRFANPVYCAAHHSVIAVCEDHRESESQPLNYLVEISLADPHKNAILAQGQGFYNWPTLNDDGTKLAFVGWDEGEMPWTTTKLWVAQMNNSHQKIGLEPDSLQCVCDQGASSQPLWIKHSATHAQTVNAQNPLSDLEDQLIFANDSRGYLNLYRLENVFTNGSPADSAIRRRCLHQRNAEFAAPAWNLGIRNFAQLDYEHLAVSYAENGVWSFGLLNIASALLEKLDVDAWEPNLAGLTAGHGRILALADNLHANSALLELTKGQINVLDQTNPINPDPQLVSVGQAVSWPTANSLCEVDGKQPQFTGSSKAELLSHGFFYPPKLAIPPEAAPAVVETTDLTAEDSQLEPISSSISSNGTSHLPPLIVMVHGGPTSQCTRRFDPQLQFWTSRGFAVLQVNHRGSTGYGRAYQDALNGQWGIYDVVDCVTGVAYICQQGLADPHRVFIRGGSAGGFTTLAALVSTPVFRGGCSRYGIADLEKLVASTHKFEAAYTDFLIGPYPQDKALYQERSPLNNIAGLQTPLLILQGAEDKVVPPDQAHLMADAAKAQGVAVDLHIYPEEGHGFRQSENVADAFARELAFYQSLI